MAELTDLKIVKIYAGDSGDGKAVFEEIPMFSLGSRSFKLAASPSLALGLAKGDTIELDESTGDYSVVNRAGVICVQIYFHSDCEDNLGIRYYVQELLDGTLDGFTSKNAALSIPFANGFPRIEYIMQILSEKFNFDWYFGNVYSSDGETPMNWWEGELLEDSIELD